MTGRERIKAVFDGKRPDCVPFAPLIGRYYVMSLPALGIPLGTIAPYPPAEAAGVPESLKRDLCLHEIETIKYVGADVLYRHIIPYRIEYGGGVEAFADGRRDYIHPVPVLRSGFSTPRGKLVEETRESKGTEYIAKHLLESEEDFRLFMDVLDAARVVPDYTPYTEFDDYIGEDGIATVTGPVTPIQDLLQFKAGVERTVFTLLDSPALTAELFGKMHELNKTIYRVLAESPAEVIITYEDTSTTIMGPDWYEQYCRRELDDYSDILHAAGKLHIVHMCGKLRGLTGLVAAGKMDGIDSVCPPETGDLEPGDAVRQIKKLIIGGLDPAYLAAANADNCKKYALEKLRQIPAGSPFILCTGDSTAAGTPVENLKTIAAAVKEFGVPQ
jgi:hypothetical protein